jgi:hypothetical protein
MAELVPISAALIGLFPSAINFTSNAFHKIGFDLDVVGRQREISKIEERIRMDYASQGGKMNIAVWNMHVRMEYQLDNLIVQGFQPMGRGGGFEVRVFSGGGYIENKGHSGYDNWRCSGNVRQEGIWCISSR